MVEKQKFIDIKINKKYEKSSDFRKYYVTGAIGGFKNPYDFRLSFYNIDSNDFLIEAQKFKEEGLTDDEITKNLNEMEMSHEIQCEVIMTERTARELCNFLERELKALEERRNKIKSKANHKTK